VNQLLARMAEMVVSGTDGDVLVCLGLGSCVGLALLETSQRACALAHIVLPVAGDETTAGSAVKFADTAVPELIGEMTRLGARRSAMSAVAVGGAQMFTLDGGAGLDIGARNEEAVRKALAEHRIPLVASMTGGSVGRTMRVYVGSRRVTYREAGGDEVNLLEPMGVAA
jgi:chemotaxis protein CheD